jgi:hypothetical protein
VRDDPRSTCHHSLISSARAYPVTLAPRPGSNRPRSKDRPERTRPRRANGNLWGNRGLLESARPTPACRSAGRGLARPRDRWRTVGGERLPRRVKHPTKPLQIDRQTVYPAIFSRFSSAYSLVCFGMARSRSGVKNRVKTTSSSLLLGHRMMAGSRVYSPWKSAFAMMGSTTRARGPLGGVGAALCP